MNPNDEQQRLYQMFQQMNGPDPYARMMPMPNSPYYPCWPTPFPQAMMGPPPNQKYPFPEQFMHEQALQMNSLQQNQGGMGLNGMPQGMPNMPPMAMGLPPGFGMGPMGPGQMGPGQMGPGPMGPIGQGGMQLPGMGPMQGSMGQMPPFDFPFKPQGQMQGPMQQQASINQQMQQQQQQHQQHQQQQQQQQQQQVQQQQQQQQAQNAQNTQAQQNLEQGFSQVVNEFQLKILNMFVMQNQMLLDFKNKNANLEGTITQILDEITNLQRIVEQKFDNAQVNDDFVSRMSIPPQELTSNNMLLKQLLYNGIDFQYQLVLTNDLEMPLFKDKNFNLDITLKDMKGQNVKNSAKIELEIQLYSSDDKPLMLQQNSQNQAIFRQPEDNIWLEEGESHIEKLQINEVTSHYQNGWVYMIVFPIKSECKFVQDEVNPNLVKPLIVQIIVKSKKTQKKSSRSRSRSHERLRRLEKLEDKSSSESENENDNENENKQLSLEKELEQEKQQQVEQEANKEQKKDLNEEIYQNNESES